MPDYLEKLKNTVLGFGAELFGYPPGLSGFCFAVKVFEKDLCR